MLFGMRRIITLAALLCTPGLTRAQAPALEETCLPEIDAADAVSFGIDPQGTTHLARLYRFTGELEYVRISRSGSRSALQIAPFISQIADDEVTDTSLALEGNRPWVCYYDAPRDRLQVARLSGNQWVAETVDTGPGRGRWCSLVVDGSTPIVAYGSDDGALRVARRTGSNRWSASTVDAPPGLAVGRDADLAQIPGLGLVVAHRTATDRLRVTWQVGDIWRSAEPLTPDTPTGASPRVVDAGGGELWIAHGGPASNITSDGGLFLTTGPPDAMTTFTLAQEAVGGSLGAIRRGRHLVIATREKQRSALFGNADALSLWTDAATAPTIAYLQRNGPGEQRHVHRDVDLALDPFGNVVVLTSDQTESMPGSPISASVCLYRPADADADGVPDATEALYGADPQADDTDADGAGDFDELLAQTPVARSTTRLADPARYGPVGCTPLDETFDGAPIYRFAGAPRVGCQFLGFMPEPDAVYAIDFAWRVDAGTLSAWPGLGDSNRSALGRVPAFTGDGRWHQARHVVAIPPDNQGDLRAVFRVSNGEGDIANVRVTRIDPALLPGGSFEFSDLRGWRSYGPAPCTHATDDVVDGRGSLGCADGQRMQVVGIEVPPGRYLLSGAGRVADGLMAVRVGDANSNADIDRHLTIYARDGWQTFSRVLDLPHGATDLRVVVLAYGDVRVDALRLQPAPGLDAVINGDLEGPLTAAWTARERPPCVPVRTALLEGETALACSGRSEARQTALPVRGGRVYRLTAALDCLIGDCTLDMAFDRGPRALGFPLTVTEGPIAYERVFRVPDDATSADVVFAVDGEALLDDVRLEPLPEAISIVTNGSFEAPFELGWRRYGPAGCTSVASDAWDGGRILRCVGRGAQQVGVPARPGVRYRLSWHRRGPGTVKVLVGDANSNADAFGATYSGRALGPAWVAEDRVFVWPADGSSDLRVVMRATGEVEIDALRLEPLPAGESLVPEGDFDDGVLSGWTRYGPEICQSAAAAAFDGAGGAACANQGMQHLALPVAAGRAYRLQYAWRVDSGVLYARLGIGTSNVDFEGAGLVSGRTDGWQQRDRRIVIPADFATDARLVFRATGEARVDRVRLIPD